ncbi:hypothetical protein D6827_03640, partial [Candidatus Parcubacteria bacterium]
MRAHASFPPWGWWSFLPNDPVPPGIDRTPIVTGARSEFFIHHPLAKGEDVPGEMNRRPRTDLTARSAVYLLYVYNLQKISKSVDKFIQ